MGTDAHSGAARRDGQHQPQGGAPAVQPDGVAVQRGAGQNVLAAGQPRGGNALRVGKNGLGGTGAQHLPLVQHDHFFAQAVGLVPVVGHQQGSARKVCQQAAYLALYLLPQVAVQRAERLVQHQDAGLAHQNARQRGALLLSAGKLGRVALGKRFQPHGAQHFGAGGAAGGRVFFCLQAAEDILLHGHVGEQGVVLEQQPYAPLLRRQVDVLCTVKQHPPVQHDASAVRLYDACNASQCHAFAAAGSTQQSGGGVAGGKGGAEGEAVQLFFNADFKAHFRPPAFCFFSSRFTASSTTAEMAISTSTHRMAPSSSLVRQSW